MVSAPCTVVYSQVPSPTLAGDGNICVLIFKDGVNWFSCDLQFPYNVCHNRDARSLLMCQIAMILMRLLIPNFIAIESMIWQTWRWLGSYLPLVPLLPMMVPASLWAVVVKSGIFDAFFLGELISVIESEWLGCCWMRTWTSRSSCLYPTFCGGLGNYLLAFPYSLRVSGKICWLTNATPSSWKCKCGISCLTQAQAFS